MITYIGDKCDYRFDEVSRIIRFNGNMMMGDDSQFYQTQQSQQTAHSLQIQALISINYTYIYIYILFLYRI